MKTVQSTATNLIKSALIGGLFVLTSASAEAKPREVRYDVWGGNVLKLRYDVSKFGYVKLGSASKTATFSGSYKYYYVAVKSTDVLYLDAARMSDGTYYHIGSLARGNVRGDSWLNLEGPPDNRYAVLDGPYSGEESGYGAYAIFYNTGRWTSMTFYVYEEPAKPKAPTALNLLVTSTRAIQMSWTDNSANETGFIIQRAPARNGPWRKVSKVGANVTSYASKSLKPGTLYFFRVQAINDGGKSAFTPAVSARTRQSSAQAMHRLLMGSLPKTE